MSFSWQGASGRWYEFDVARAKRAWEPLGGLYMFVKPGDLPTMEAGGPICLYLAQTASFAESLARHDAWGAAQSLGAAEIHLLVVSDPAKRAAIEQDIYKSHTPILNRQQARPTSMHMGSVAGGGAGANAVTPPQPYRGYGGAMA
jgi:hypothetical protein